MHDETSTRTLGHYAEHALSFREGTIDHDVSQNVTALLTAIEGPPPFKILDFGCGPGRDLRRFRELGHEPTGLDGCAQFVEMAKAHSGADVWLQDFLALSLPDTTFDGVFANASLFHVPGVELPRVLRQLHGCLKPHGVLFCSNPRGNEEGWRGERYGCHFELDRWQALCAQSGFVLLHHFYRPDGMPREQQPWLAMVLRKTTG